jgi:hypothetical protein
MPRPSVTFVNLTVARLFRDNLDTAFGYPRSNVVMPGGLHGPTGATSNYASLVKHPTLNRWAYPDDPLIVGKRPQVPLPAGGTMTDLDSDPTWDGAQPASLRQEDLE